MAVMSESIRIVLFNAVGTREMSFRSSFDQLPGASIIAETTDWDSLRDKLRDPSIDLVAVGLDDPKEAGFDIVHRVAQFRPSCGIVGISQRTDPASIIRAMRAGCGQYV